MYRVSLQGRFLALTPEQRAELVRGSSVASMSFTRAGTFTCDRSAAVFTFRCEVDVDGEPQDAVDAARAALAAHGYDVEVRRATATDQRQVRVRPPR